MSTRLNLSKLSLKDALDLASLIESEAHQRYKMFASQLGLTGGYDAGAFFATMAENEAKYGREMAARRKGLFTELRDEETEHVKMLQEAMGKLPPSASVVVEFDLDESPFL